MGDVVLVIEPDVPRRHWNLRRIEAVYPGQDGLVRVVDVRAGDDQFPDFHLFEAEVP